MEWTWLRDWWRLKRLRHSQMRHSHEDIYYGYDSDEDDDDDDICYCDECVNVGFCSETLTTLCSNQIPSYRFLARQLALFFHKYTHGFYSIN